MNNTIHASESKLAAFFSAHKNELKGDKGDQGLQGMRGESGTNGVSPTVSASSITGGTRVTITDSSGAHVFDVMNGTDGSPGGKGDQGEPGPRGIQGPQGIQGLQGIPGVPGADGSQVSVSATGTATDTVRYITIDGIEKKLGGGGGTWGSITGTLANQTDLQDALDAKLSVASGDASVGWNDEGNLTVTDGKFVGSFDGEFVAAAWNDYMIDVGGGETASLPDELAAQIGNHNSANDAHSDIRTSISNVSASVAAKLDKSVESSMTSGVYTNVENDGSRFYILKNNNAKFLYDAIEDLIFTYTRLSSSSFSVRSWSDITLCSSDYLIVQGYQTLPQYLSASMPYGYATPTISGGAVTATDGAVNRLGTLAANVVVTVPIPADDKTAECVLRFDVSDTKYEPSFTAPDAVAISKYILEGDDVEAAATGTTNLYEQMVTVIPNGTNADNKKVYEVIITTRKLEAAS